MIFVTQFPHDPIFLGPLDRNLFPLDGHRFQHEAPIPVKLRAQANDATAAHLNFRALDIGVFRKGLSIFLASIFQCTYKQTDLHINAASPRFVHGSCDTEKGAQRQENGFGLDGPPIAPAVPHVVVKKRNGNRSHNKRV